MIAASPSSTRAKRVYLWLGVGLCVLALAWFGVRAVASLQARKALAVQLAVSTAEIARLGTPRARLVLPPFDGRSVTKADCAVAQHAVSLPTPTLPPHGVEHAWLPANADQVEFAAAHGAEIAAFGEAALRCDRVAPARALGGSAWEQPIEIYRRTKLLLVAGRVRALQGDCDAAVALFLQSRRLGVELGLDGSVIESIAGATAIHDADDALARLVALGVSESLLGHVARDVAALGPFTPDLASAVRLDQAEQTSRVASTLLMVPFLLDLNMPAWRIGPGPWSFWQRAEAVILPASAFAANELSLTRAGTDRELRGFTSLGAESADPAAEEESSSAWSVYGLAVFSLASRKARDAHWRLLARNALLDAVLTLGRARTSDGRYPPDPKLPLDPFAPGKSLGYQLLPDGRYRLSSSGVSKDPNAAWIVVSGPGSREPEPAR